MAHITWVRNLKPERERQFGLGRSFELWCLVGRVNEKIRTRGEYKQVKYSGFMKEETELQ